MNRSLRLRIVSTLAAAAAIAAIGILTAMPAAQGQCSQPALPGAGQPTQASASNVGDQAWIYTGDPSNSAPVQTTGNILVSVIAATQTDTPTSESRASVTSTFAYPSSSATYVVNFTALEPVGIAYTHYGGAGITKPVFGAMNVAGLSLPPTLAYIVVFGKSTIRKGDHVIAANQRSVAMVTQALHDPTTHAWLSAPDPNRREVALIVPGPLVGAASSATDFPSGSFCIYWPDAAFDLHNVGGAVNLPKTAPTAPAALVTPTAGRGPVTPPLAGTTAPVGTITITMTESGIESTSTETVSGLYDVVIVNRASRNEGVALTGTDLCCTTYKRFTPVLKSTDTQAFRWYFAPGRVTFKDFSHAKKTSLGYDDLHFSGHSAQISFQ